MTFVCSTCGQRLSQWTGRCPGCAAWGTVDQTTGTPARGGRDAVRSVALRDGEDEPRIRTGVPGLDRVLGGGLVPGSVVMVAGAPGIGKSTLVLHLVGALVAGGTACLLVSGEESRAQVASRARRLRIPVDDVGFASVVLPLLDEFLASKGKSEHAATLVAITRIRHAHPGLAPKAAVVGRG